MIKFFKRKSVSPEVVELEYTEQEFMQKRYEWLETDMPIDEINSSYKQTVVCLLKYFDKRLRELEK